MAGDHTGTNAECRRRSTAPKAFNGTVGGTKEHSGGQFVERGVAASTNVRHVFGKGGGHLQDPDTGMADESARHLEQPSTHDGDHPAADGEGPAGLFAVIEEIGRRRSASAAAHVLWPPPGLGISRSSQRCRPPPWANSPNNTSPDCAIMDSSVAARLKGARFVPFSASAPPVNLPAGGSFRREHYTGNPYRYRGLQLFSTLSNRGNRIITQP